QGAFIETCGGHSFECGPHTVLLKPPGEPHSNVYGTRLTRCLVIEVEEGRWPALAAIPTAFGSVKQAQSGAIYRLALRACHELRLPDTASPLAVEGLVLEMVAEAARIGVPKTASSPPWLNRARQYVEANFAKPLGLAEVASAVGIHPFHLARQF